MKENKHINTILELLSSSIDVKGQEDLYANLQSYFKGFSNIKSSSVVSFEDESLVIFGKLKNKKLTKEQFDTSGIPDHYLGYQMYLDDDQKCLALPIYHKNNEYNWLVIETDGSDVTDVFNQHFFKYLENVNLFRDHKENVETLKVLASTDDVTGLFNQRKLAEDLEEAVKWHEKEHEKFSIMFIDVDHFKNVNDDYGHLIGSKILLDLGKALKLILRESDHVYRYGGDEFVVIMPNVETSIVYQIASRILSQLKNHLFDIDNGDTYQMSLSIGIAEYPTDAKSAMEIIRFADEMMYKSKKSGRGKVFHVNEVANVDADSE